MWILLKRHDIVDFLVMALEGVNKSFSGLNLPVLDVFPHIDVPFVSCR